LETYVFPYNTFDRLARQKLHIPSASSSLFVSSKDPAAGRRRIPPTPRAAPGSHNRTERGRARSLYIRSPVGDTRILAVVLGEISSAQSTRLRLETNASVYRNRWFLLIRKCRFALWRSRPRCSRRVYTGAVTRPLGSARNGATRSGKTGKRRLRDTYTERTEKTLRCLLNSVKAKTNNSTSY